MKSTSHPWFRKTWNSSILATCASGFNQTLFWRNNSSRRISAPRPFWSFWRTSNTRRRFPKDGFVTQQVHEILDPMRQGAEVFIGGLPEMEFEGTTNMMDDLKLFTPLTLILVVGLLIVSFRSWCGIALPLVAVLVALLWTLGPMALMGRPLTITTLTLPSLLIANGSSYVIHFLTQYYRAMTRAYQSQEKTPTPGNKKNSFLPLSGPFTPHPRLDRESYRAVLLETLSYTHVAILISATTTMAGFGSLVISRIPTFVTSEFLPPGGCFSVISFV